MDDDVVLGGADVGDPAGAGGRPGALGPHGVRLPSSHRSEDDKLAEEVAAGDVRPGLDDGAAAVRQQRVVEGNGRVLVAAGEEVLVVESGGGQADQDLMVARLGDGDILDLEAGEKEVSDDTGGIDNDISGVSGCEMDGVLRVVDLARLAGDFLEVEDSRHGEGLYMRQCIRSCFLANYFEAQDEML